MKWYNAILTTLIILILSSWVTGMIGFQIMLVIVPLTALLVAIDSTKIELKKYKSGISLGPIVLFIGVVGLWIIGFPWYLIMRYKIKNGQAVFKESNPPPIAEDIK